MHECVRVCVCQVFLQHSGQVRRHLITAVSMKWDSILGNSVKASKQTASPHTGCPKN